MTLAQTLIPGLVHFRQHCFGEIYNFDNDPNESHKLWVNTEYAVVKADNLLRSVTVWCKQ